MTTKLQGELRPPGHPRTLVGVGAVSEVLFWLATGLITYVFLFFPVLLALRAVLRPRRVNGGDRPYFLSVVIAARDEEKSIAGKLESILASGFPADRFEVIVASDGSRDSTEEIVGDYRARGVRLISLPAVGKAAALGAAVEASRGALLVFTDANGELAPGALRALVWPFADPAVGGTAGDQRFESEDAPNVVSVGERRYWSVERMLKRAESRAGDVISATGGLYAIRRELFETVPGGVTDDAFLSIGVVAKGHRLVFAPGAVVHEPLASAPGAEFGRKIRVITRGLRTVWVHKALLNPLRYGFYAIELWSHKVLRRLMAVPLLVALATSIVGWERGLVFRAAALGQIVFYVAGAIGLLLARTRIVRLSVLSLPAYFCAAHAAGLVATFNFIRGVSIHEWQPGRQRRGVELSGPIVTHRSPDTRWRDGAATMIVASAVGAAAGARPAMVAVSVVLLVMGAVVVLRPDLSVLAAVALLYSNAIVLAVNQHGAPVVALLIVPGLLLLPLLDFLVVKRERVEFSPAFPFLLIFAAAQAVSTIQATDTTRAITSLGMFLVEGIGIYFVMINVVRSRETLYQCLRVLFVVAALLSALMVFKAATGNYANDFWGFAQDETTDQSGLQQVDEETRAGEQFGDLQRQSGPLGGAGRFAQYLLPLVPIGLLLGWRVRMRAGAAVAGLAAVVVTVAIALTFTRGAFLGLVIMAALMAMLRLLKPTHLLAGLVILVAFLVVVPSYRDRLLSIGGVFGVLVEDSDAEADSSIRGRFTENAAAIYMFMDHPFIGVGPGNYAVHYRDYANIEPTNVRSGERQAHNLYLGVAAETGLFGSLAVIGVFVVTLWELLHARRRAIDGEGRRLASTFIAVVAGLMATSLLLHIAFIRYFWLFMALAAIAARVAAPREGDTTPAAIDKFPLERQGGVSG